jgi:hypothetical protein
LEAPPLKLLSTHWRTPALFSVVAMAYRWEKKDTDERTGWFCDGVILRTGLSSSLSESSSRRHVVSASGSSTVSKSTKVGALAFVLKTWPSLGGTRATRPNLPAFSKGACASGVLLGNASSSFRRRAGLEEPSTPRMASATSQSARTNRIYLAKTSSGGPCSPSL